jgi:hypothetical protein
VNGGWRSRYRLNLFLLVGNQHLMASGVLATFFYWFETNVYTTSIGYTTEDLQTA